MKRIIPILAALALMVSFATESADAQWWRWGRRKPPPVTGGSSELSSLPLLDFEDNITYIGALRMPIQDYQTCSFENTPNGGGSTVKASATSFYHTKGNGCVTEVNLGTFLQSSPATDVSDLNTATFAQTWVYSGEIFGGMLADFGEGSLVLSGMLPHNGRLIFDGHMHYDSGNVTHISMMASTLILQNATTYPGAQTFWQGDATHAGRETQGLTGQYMAPIPSEWQTALHGKAVAGGQCMSIIGRTSNGPAAFAFDPDDVNVTEPIPATPLVHYSSSGGWTLGAWDTSAKINGATTCIAGVAIIKNTRTTIFLGRNGTGPHCYGDTTAVEAEANGTTICYDPENPGSHGQSAYPYRYEYWLYDTLELSQVAAGTRTAWSVTPYAYEYFDLPYTHPVTGIGGFYYDETTKILYVMQIRADNLVGSNNPWPILHAFQVDDTP